jgi:hypothetical protein
LATPTIHSERQNLKICSENAIKLSLYCVMCDWSKEVKSIRFVTNGKQVRTCSQCETVAALSLCYCKFVDDVKNDAENSRIFDKF